MFLQAEEITLTIGQAFELAYKKFLESKGKDLEKEKKEMVMHKRIELLENENKELKKRLTDSANIKGDNDVKQYMRENNVSAFTIKITQESKFYISSTIKIWKKMLTKSIWADKIYSKALRSTFLGEWKNSCTSKPCYLRSVQCNTVFKFQEFVHWKVSAFQ